MRLGQGAGRKCVAHDTHQHKDHKAQARKITLLGRHPCQAPPASQDHRRRQPKNHLVKPAKGQRLQPAAHLGAGE